MNIVENDQQTLGIESFAQAFDVSPRSFSETLRKAIKSAKLDYTTLSNDASLRIQGDIQKKIDDANFSRVGAQREALWQDVWQEALEKFKSSQQQLSSLIPKFTDVHPHLRYQSSFIQAQDAGFEARFISIVQHWIFETYLENVNHIYEFGCGSSSNLVAFAQQDPTTILFGLDWSHSAVTLANLIGQSHGFNLQGHPFDFFNPDHHLTLAPNSAAFTFCALEQIGSKFKPFINYLLAAKPSICIHIEPIFELYNPNNAVDKLAMDYHQQRDYLSGFLPYLKTLEIEGTIKIDKIKRFGFGSLYHEGYSLVVWKPNL